LHQLAEAYYRWISLDFRDSSLVESDLRAQFRLRHSPSFAKRSEVRRQLGGGLES